MLAPPRWTPSHVPRSAAVPCVTEPELDAHDLEHRWARLLLDSEAGTDSSPTDILEATNRVLARLQEPLSRWLGRDGSHAVLGRALNAARAQHPLLADTRAEPPAADQLLRLSGLAESAAHDEPEHRTELRAALVSVLTALFSTLTRLIGGDLVLRLLQQVWPSSRLDPSAAPTTVPPVMPDTRANTLPITLTNEITPEDHSRPQAQFQTLLREDRRDD